MPRFTGTSESHRISVCLTFDFDGQAYSHLIGATSPSALARGAYGNNEGVARILRLLHEYDLPATFFIPGDTADRFSERVAEIVNAGYEIGHHGHMHEMPTSLDEAAEREMLERGFESLARHGVRPTGYRSPFWEISDNTYQLLAEFGIEYDASQVGADRPHLVLDKGEPTPIVEVPGAWELTDSPHFLFSYIPYLVGMSAPSKVQEIWTTEFDELYQENSGACYVLTMHPEIIGRPHRMAMLRNVIEHILEHDDVWFAETRDVAAEYRTATLHSPTP